ncbi:hypothetical protein PNIG_a0189 [Pseudoalteromonas nigrifaciens]|uniref:Uncharacterized protein n=1 Tax=Pseudoalteromonas nigrifaciens TaxID=28109 RepID=A0AAC9UF24_9GAMM|nr:hypothetical protein PNIG_a0189 [Pseudoalteromonas nigrifaciens]SJN23435.1 hypothetical protein CZ797_03430 [Pseudoalteromonas sp. JB197]
MYVGWVERSETQRKIPYQQTLVLSLIGCFKLTLRTKDL